MLRFFRLGIVGAVLCLSACQVSTEVTLTVADDGSGRVEVVVGLDEEALEAVGDPEALFATADLVEAGWTVSARELEADGVTRVRAMRSFASPAQAEAVLGQVAGDTGALVDISLTRTDSFTTTTYLFEAVADLSAGLAVFSDADLAEALDGEPLGESVEDIEDRFGASLAELFSLTVRVELPGELVETSAEGAAEWTPRVDGDPVTMTATSEIRDETPLRWVGAAVASLLVAIGLVGWRLIQRHRFRRSRGDSASA